MLKWLGLASDTTTKGLGGVVGAPRIPAGSIRTPLASAPKPVSKPAPVSVSPLGNRRVTRSADILEEMGAPKSIAPVAAPTTAPAAAASAALMGGARRKNRKTNYRMPGRRVTRKAGRKNRRASRKSRRASRK